MGAIIRFSRSARTSDVDAQRDIDNWEAQQTKTIATLSATLQSLQAALAVVAAQIAALPEGPVRMELTVQHLHLNIAAFNVKQAITDIGLT
jgi:hypothetical protein